jgi:1A family penicillin-binding protein
LCLPKNNVLMRLLSKKYYYIHHIVYLITIVGAFCLGGTYYFIHHSEVYFSRLKPAHHQDSVLLDDEGVVWARFQLDNRGNVSIVQMPKHLIHAFIATEDRQFYDHIGISWYGIIRSLFYNTIYRRFAQGASTITQQLVRLLLGDTTKTLQRKIKEQLFAIIIEQQFSKNQILEMYFNHLYFGCGIYGVSAAARRFWNKKPEDLTIDESAILAGIVKNPSKYCPLTQSLNSLQRRNTVLSCMVQAGFISTNEMETLQALPLSTTQDDTNLCCAPHARDAIRQQLEEIIGLHMLYTAGLTIKTTLNRSMQQHAQLCFKTSLEQLRIQVHKSLDGALVCIKNNTGEIKAMVGGYDYATSQFNRATQAHRQLGSIFKPILYTIGLEQNMSLSQIEHDEPIRIVDHNKIWEPRNLTRRFDGPMTRARALISSNNIIAVKTALSIGTQLIAQKAQECGLPPQKPYASLALGCIDATPTEAAGMFNVLVNKGYYVVPYFVQWVKDANGSTIWQVHNHPTPIFSWTSCSSIIHLLGQAVGHWINYLKTMPLLCASTGKTGTTNDARNCWFVGATPSYTTSVYLGTDDHSALDNIYGIKSAFPLWLSFNRSINQPVSNFNYDPHLKPVIIDTITGENLTIPTKRSLTLLEPEHPKTHTPAPDCLEESFSKDQDYASEQTERWILDDV